MNHTISIVLLALFGVIVLVDYFKSKKAYMLLVLIPILFSIFFQTPFANSINKTLSNILVGISILVATIIFYLSIKDDKKQK